MGDKPWPASSSGSICSRIARQRSNSACQSIGAACATVASVSINIAAIIFFMSDPASAKVARKPNLVPALPKKHRLSLPLRKHFSLLPFPLLDDPQPHKTSGEDHHDDQDGVLDHWNAPG
jgi:hypothetical protein